MAHLLAPSVLAADFSKLHEAIALIENTEADWVHLDVMDGRFVPNISFGFPVIRDLRPFTNKPFDVHLMIEEPEKYVKAFREAGADHLSVHIEASPNLHRTVQMIKGEGMKAGVAINPHTNVRQLEDILPDLDIVILMSVNPGYGGQSFIEHSYRKLKKLIALREETASKALIEIDGGVSATNAGRLVNLGANVLVAGSSVFKAPDPREAIRELKSPSIHTTEI